MQQHAYSSSKIPMKKIKTNNNYNNATKYLYSRNEIVGGYVGIKCISCELCENMQTIFHKKTQHKTHDTHIYTTGTSGQKWDTKQPAITTANLHQIQ